MPTDFARINAPRVAKVLEILDLVGKSAASQRATGEERAKLLAPIVDTVEAYAPHLFLGDETEAQAEKKPEQEDMAAGAVERAPVAGHDREAIKDAYLQIARGDRVLGMRAMQRVILGWAPPHDTTTYYQE